MPKNKSKRVPDSEKLFEDLLEAKQKLDSENLNLAHENASLKMAMSCKEATWRKEKESMQNADYERLKEELELDLKDAKKELRIQEKEYRSLSNRNQSQQTEIHKIRRDLKQKCNQVNELEYSIKQREQVIDSTVHEKQALDKQITELTTKLKAMGSKVLQNEPNRQTEIKALKDQLSREQAEKEAGFLQIKALKDELSREQAEKKAGFLQIKALKDELSREQAEKEAGFIQIKALKDELSREQAEKKASLIQIKAMKDELSREQAEKKASLIQIKALKDELSREQAEKKAGSNGIKALKDELSREQAEKKASLIQIKALKDELSREQAEKKAGSNGIKALKDELSREKAEKQAGFIQIKALKDELSCEQAEKQAGSNKIKELERLLKVTEEKWVTKHEARIVHTDQMIASLTSQNMALEAINQKLICMQQAIETRILQNKTEWETKVDALEDHLSCEQAEKEAGFLKIKELEKLVSDTEQMWAAKHEADIKMLILKQIKLQELALMTDKDKAKREKEQKKAKKEAEKRLKKELKEKRKQEKR
ncbi:flagellar attachment zone protein 1-like isoform X1 [Paralichthys olivaceus]|uniref:flagellar attachment zone protein 1-like isoform X1 n=1 Tax=Paralichthys olivaceus TaxID=8255 RepID=UPI003752D16F